MGGAALIHWAAGEQKVPSPLPPPSRLRARRARDAVGGRVVRARAAARARGVRRHLGEPLFVCYLLLSFFLSFFLFFFLSLSLPLSRSLFLSLSCLLPRRLARGSSRLLLPRRPLARGVAHSRAREAQQRSSNTAPSDRTHAPRRRPICSARWTRSSSGGRGGALRCVFSR